MAFIRDDIVPPLVALENQPGLGQFPDMEEEVAATQAGHLRYVGKCPRLDHERRQDLEPLGICDRFEDFLYYRFICNGLIVPGLFAGFLVDPQRLHQVHLLLKEPVDFGKTGVAPVERPFSPHGFHLLAVGADDLVGHLPVADMAGGILEEIHEDLVAFIPHLAIVDHVGGEILLCILHLVIGEEPGIILLQIGEYAFHMLLVGPLDEPLQIGTETRNLRLQFAYLGQCPQCRTHNYLFRLSAALHEREGHFSVPESFVYFNDAQVYISNNQTNDR